MVKDAMESIYKFNSLPAAVVMEVISTLLVEHTPNPIVCVCCTPITLSVTFSHLNHIGDFQLAQNTTECTYMSENDFFHRLSLSTLAMP